MLLQRRKVRGGVVEATSFARETAAKLERLGAHSVHVAEVGEREHGLEAVSCGRRPTGRGVVARDPNEEGTHGRRRRVLIELLQRTLVIVPRRVRRQGGRVRRGRSECGQGEA